MDNLTPEDVAKKGEEIYQKKLKPLLEPAHNGRYAIIDIETEKYFLGDTIIEAADKARKEFPGHLFYTVKIGEKGIFKMGSISTRRTLYAWQAQQ